MSPPATLKCNSGLRFVAQPVVPNKQHNKALHPTAYSFVRSSLRFRRRVSLVVLPSRAALRVPSQDITLKI